jgi:hypothetical protein
VLLIRTIFSVSGSDISNGPELDPDSAQYKFFQQEIVHTKLAYKPKP